MIQRLPAEPEEGAPRRGSYLSIFLAFMLACGVFLALFFLTLGAVGPMLVIGAGVFALGAFHYLVWGWWLSKLIHQDAATSQENPRSSDELRR